MFCEEAVPVSSCCIVNPIAGKGKAKAVWSAIAPYAQSLGAQVCFTKGPGDATELARSLAAAGAERVVAIGGDGTVSEVVNGLMGSGACLGVIPGGTGNDFCRVVGIPFAPLPAAQLALTGAAAPMDIGQIEGGRYFFNVAGIGFDAEVARAVNSYPKYLGGTIPYLLGILKTLWRYRPAPMEIEVDGRVYQRKVFLLAVGIAQAYGGGMRVLPDAKVDDGLLDVVIAGDVGRMEVLRLVPKLYKAGHVGHPKVEFTRGRHIRITSPQLVAMHLDGDVVGTLPASFLIHPGALGVITGPRP